MYVPVFFDVIKKKKKHVNLIIIECHLQVENRQPEYIEKREETKRERLSYEPGYHFFFWR